MTVAIDLSVCEPVLIVGPATVDVLSDARQAGGAVCYAARVATALGVHAHVLTIAGDDADLGPLEGHTVATVRSEHTLVYEHHLDGGTRRMRLLARPDRPLRATDLPPAWPAPRTVLLAPLLPDDVDVGSFLDASTSAPPREVGLLAQGLQRVLDADGVVEALGEPAAALTAAAQPDVSVFLSAEESAGWPDGALDALVGRARRVVRTLGAAGAEVRDAAGLRRVPAAPAGAVVDPTGAGDVFATAFILAVSAGEHEIAGRLAAVCAAANVERRGPAPLPPRAELEARASRLAGAAGDRGAQGDPS
ncbi:MAG: PfkB family carbohydrate kinase [Dehalococcoidia bacterium]